jgi:AraC-like DNA-binding protein
MSPARQRSRHLTLEQEPYLIVRSFAANYSSGYVIEPHLHDWRQLLFASSGAMTVHGGSSCWMIPPGRAVFIPAGCGHSIGMWGEVALRSLAFPAAWTEPALAHPECRVLSVTPLLRELILRVIEMGALDSRVPADHRLAQVLLDQMAAAPVTPAALPMPSDPRARAVAGHVLADPAAEDSIAAIARRYGAARRTLERLFRAETGMSFGLWRQKARMLHSVRLLAEGAPVTDAALDAGYRSVSAFIAAFKRTFGCTPGRF